MDALLARSRIDEQRANSKPLNAFATLMRLRSYLWPVDRPDLRLRSALAFVLLVVAKGVGMLSPYLFKLLTDTFTEQPVDQALGELTSLGLILVGLYALSRALTTVIAQVRDALFAVVAQNSVRRLANSTFAHLHALSLSFHLGRKTGGLFRVIERATKGIETLVRFAIFNVVPVLVELSILIVIFALYFDFRYVITLLLTATIYTVFTFYASEARLKIRRAWNATDSDLNTKAVDSLLNYETVKYFGNEGLEQRRFDESAARYEEMAIKTYITLGFVNGGQIVIYSTGLAFCMGFSIHAITLGEQTIGDLVMLNLFMLQLYQPLNFLGTVYREIRQGILDIGEMFTLLGHKPEVVDREGARPLVVKRAVVKFERVCFGYEASRPILNEVSFEAKPQSKIAFVGPSGGGKSTICRLIFRFFDVNSGRITIDGQDLRDVTQKSLRSYLGFVPQDTVLFNDTIGYNIAYGNPEASPEAIEEAAKLAQIHGLIATLPAGYETIVGERGLRLSGGEKQRVAIARMILKGPPILVFDEATSALDTQTEKNIQSALARVGEGRTILVVAHRLSTIVDADEIIVLDKGQIVESGTHEALLKAGGVYARLWARQLETGKRRTTVSSADSSEPSAFETSQERQKR